MHTDGVGLRVLAFKVASCDESIVNKLFLAFMNMDHCLDVHTVWQLLVDAIFTNPINWRLCIIIHTSLKCKPSATTPLNLMQLAQRLH